MPGHRGEETQSEIEGEGEEEEEEEDERFSVFFDYFLSFLPPHFSQFPSIGWKRFRKS